MVPVNPKSVIDLLQEVVKQTQDVDLTQYPDELRFLDSGKVGDGWWDFGVHDVRFYSKCFAHSKHDDAEEWQPFDEILLLIQWVAEGKYRNFPRPAEDHAPYQYYRLLALEAEAVEIEDHLPAQLRISTPGTYLGQDRRSYIHVKVEQKLPAATEWTMDEGLGLHDALEMLESGVYRMDEPDVDKPERTFRRLY